jgi:hypothetical protein
MQKRALFRVRLPMAASRAVKSGASTLYTFSRRGVFSSLLVLQPHLTCEAALSEHTRSSAFVKYRGWLV